MRIIAGRLGGRNFSSPHSHATHPMSEKMRGALFNALGDISGLKLLDAFAGSGALSFEAVSRGAASVVAIDSDKAAQQAIASSINLLGVTGSITLIRKTVTTWLSRSDETFDIVICDPPYGDIRPDLLERLMLRTKFNGIAVLSLPPAANLRLVEGFEHVASKEYGDAKLIFYRRSS